MENPKKITKRKIAETQLNRAVLLFEDEADYISALTLAGAAEEILGKMAKKKGHTTSFEDLARYTRTVWDYAERQASKMQQPLEIPDDKEVKRRINEIRNELKHNDGGDNVSIVAMFQFQAEEMICRAISNYLKLYGRLPRNKRLVNWYDDITR